MSGTDTARGRPGGRPPFLRQGSLSAYPVQRMVVLRSVYGGTELRRMVVLRCGVWWYIGRRMEVLRCGASWY
eukprot:1969774-Rhodomonas_salina.1